MSSDWSRFYILSVCMHLHVLLSLQDATRSKQQDKSIWTTFHVVRAFQDQAVAAVFGLTSLWSYFRLLPQLLFMRACLEHASMWDDTAGQRYISWPWHASALVNCWGRWTPKLTTRLVLSLDGHLPDMWIFCLCLFASSCLRGIPLKTLRLRRLRKRPLICYRQAGSSKMRDTWCACENCPRCRARWPWRLV